MATTPITLSTNDFLTGLSNLALMVELIPTNTSSAPEKFIKAFGSTEVEYGAYKLYPFVDLPAVKDYSATSSLLTVTTPTQKEEVLTSTFHKVVPLSYNAYIMRGAFTNASGMNDFIGYMLGLMDSAKTNWIQDQLLSLMFGDTLTADGSNVSITITDPSTLTTFVEKMAAGTYNQEQITIAVQNALQNIQHFTDKYNESGYTQALDVEDMRFVFCEPYHNENLVKLFATLLKSDVINESFDRPEMLVIPTDKIPAGKTNVIGWICHKRKYTFYYNFVFNGNFFDPSNLMTNNFLHFKGGIGKLDTLPCVKFTAVAPASK